ncbi:MAG: hypothetical protein ACRDS9_18030 [Pseudonocardiaceae bacterium]
MALAVVRVDRFTQSELGRSGLEELSRNLWPGRCQTCGRELGPQAPAVIVVEAGITITASLHHDACQQPRWTRNAGDITGRHLTVATSLMGIPFGDPARDPFRPTLLVNPGLEQVTLVRTDRGRYRVTTVGGYRPLGLLPPAPQPPLLDPPRDMSGLVASWLTDDRLIVRCGEMLWAHPVGPVDSVLVRLLRDCGEVVLGISTAVDPGAMTNPEPVKRILASGDLATVSVPLGPGEAAPDMTSLTVAVESDLAWADERNDADWLPVTPFEGPTYDPATGLFRIGMGMDGPGRWRLTDRGVGATNGLIAGPGGSGKSNTLRLALVEAMCSGVFDIAVADPLDRNGLLGALASYAVRSADTLAATTSLLVWTVEQLQARHAQADRWHRPDPTHCGLLVGIDDAHQVLSDPRAADLAARVAVNGPTVGVGLIAVVELVDLDIVAGRRDLLLALGQTNAFLYDQRQLQLWEALRDG